MKQQRGADEGFGLTEIMVSMLVLAIVMIAILSLLISSLTAVSSNSTRASGAQLATERIELLRGAAEQGRTCDAVFDAVVDAELPAEDGRGIPFDVDVSFPVLPTGTETCGTPGSPEDEGLVRVTVTVTSTNPSVTNPVASTTTDIFVIAEQSI